MKTSYKIPSSLKNVHCLYLWLGQGNTYYPLTYNQYSVWICKRYK